MEMEEAMAAAEDLAEERAAEVEAAAAATVEAAETAAGNHQYIEFELH
jgi:hypothetical protein